MADVRPGDRAKTKKRTGDTSFPMETASQVRSAIKLRHHGKSKSAAEVLRLCSAAIGRLMRMGKMTPAAAKAMRNMIAKARQADKAAGK